MYDISLSKSTSIDVFVADEQNSTQDDYLPNLDKEMITRLGLNTS